MKIYPMEWSNNERKKVSFIFRWRQSLDSLLDRVRKRFESVGETNDVLKEFEKSRATFRHNVLKRWGAQGYSIILIGVLPIYYPKPDDPRLGLIFIPIVLGLLSIYFILGHRLGKLPHQIQTNPQIIENLILYTLVLYISISQFFPDTYKISVYFLKLSFVWANAVSLAPYYKLEAWLRWWVIMPLTYIIPVLIMWHLPSSIADNEWKPNEAITVVWALVVIFGIAGYIGSKSYHDAQWSR